MSSSNLSKSQLRKQRNKQALQQTTQRYTQLVKLASTADVPLVFRDASAIAALAAVSPALQVALETRWGVEKYEQFVTTGVNIEVPAPDIGAVDTQDVGLFLAATMRNEILSLAENNFKATGGKTNNGRLCDAKDADTALVLLTLCKIDSVARDTISKMDNTGSLVKSLKKTVKAGEIDFLAPAQNVNTVNGGVDFKTTPPLNITALYDVIYVIDAQNVINSSPTLRSRASDWVKRHKNVNSLTQGATATGTTVGTALALTTTAYALDDSTGTAASVAAASIIAGSIANCVNYYRKGQSASAKATAQSDQIVAADKFKHIATNSRRIQLVRANTENSRVPGF